MGSSIFVFCETACLFTAYVTTCAFMNTHVHLFTYIRSVPETLRVIPVTRSTHSVTISSGASDNSWIPQALATMVQSVSKSYHSRLQRCFLDMGKMHTFQGTRLPCFAHEIRITGSVISLSFTLHTDRKHGDNFAQHEYESACAERGCEHASIQQKCVWSSVQKSIQILTQSGRYNCSIQINLKCVNNFK